MSPLATYCVRPEFSLNAMLLHSRALKTSRMRACACITCNNRPYPLCHEPHDDPPDKAQKEPHGSFEVICGGSEHDVNRVSEKTLVEVPSQTMVALAVPYNRLYSCPLPEQLMLPGFHICRVRGFRNVRYHDPRVSRHSLPPLAPVPCQNTDCPSVSAACLLHRPVNRVTVILIPE